MIQPFSLWLSIRNDFLVFKGPWAKLLAPNLAQLCLTSKVFSADSTVSEFFVNSRLLELPMTSHLTVTVVKCHQFPKLLKFLLCCWRESWLGHFWTPENCNSLENFWEPRDPSRCFMSKASITVTPTFHPQPSDSHALPRPRSFSTSCKPSSP